MDKDSKTFAMPFYSQKWDLSKWRELGFSSQEKAPYWERSCCGILCLKMALDAYLIRKDQEITPAIAEIIKRGLELNAYTDALGWSHDGLIRLAESFGFTAKSFSNLKIGQLAELIKNNQFPIISIKWAFKDNKTLKEKILFWKKYGGHLCLVVGAEEKDGKVIGFYVHHTSIKQEYNWPGRLIPVNQFKKGFTGRGLAISNK
jgi:hypothetical protein